MKNKPNFVSTTMLWSFNSCIDLVALQTLHINIHCVLTAMKDGFWLSSSLISFISSGFTEYLITKRSFCVKNLLRPKSALWISIFGKWFDRLLENWENLVNVKICQDLNLSFGCEWVASLYCQRLWSANFLAISSLMPLKHLSRFLFWFRAPRHS